ncbi:hypothetical protein SteCoe_26124 [Stentor coeruleus]|uniref:Uncharacterized protein n=1 Tax=Stentor coeruleus TaxID=5963 RepID=A0A1R2BDM7_9CILI|nr:hypothetical protein SteCoe_26124 [Stentor coeruleus]
MVEENGDKETKGVSDSLGDIVNIQKSNYLTWQKADAALLNEYLLIQSFRPNSTPVDFWSSTDFLDEGNNCYAILGPATPLQNEITDEGLNLSGNLISPHLSLSLRSLAIDIKIRLKLSAPSSFFIIFRLTQKITQKNPIIRISNDTINKGLFLSFGHISLENNHFIIEKQEKVVEKDFNGLEDKDFELSIIENGDGKIFVSISGTAKNTSIKRLEAFYDKFWPELGKCSLAMGACGERVLIKNTSIMYRNRILTSPKIRKENCACTTF